MAIIDPTTDTASEIRDIVAKARHAIPTTQPAVSSAVYYLATAIDKLVNETLVPAFKVKLDTENLDEFGPGQLEELYANISGQEAPNDTSEANTDKTTFIVAFPEIELTIKDIWPDEDAPDNPTPEDVIEAMKGASDPTPRNVAFDWMLIDHLFVQRADGGSEVEWDGS
jgi:hypothetical protein